MKQKERLRNLFLSNPNIEIPLTTILGLFIAQYNSRVLDLRRDGMNIINRTETVEGARHSFFKYVPKTREDLFG